jgi:hypothetical protein
MWYPRLPNDQPSYVYLEVELNLTKYETEPGGLKKVWWTDNPEKDLDGEYAKMDEIEGEKNDLLGSKIKWGKWKNAAGLGLFQKFQQPTFGFNTPSLSQGFSSGHNGFDIIEQGDSAPSKKEDWILCTTFNKEVIPMGAGQICAIHYGNGYPGGNEISIYHNSEYTEWSLYCHFNTFKDDLTGGKFINSQTIMGYTGYSGSSRITGPHLHLEFHIGGNAVNPNLLLIEQYQ